jgi:hypothetical protein
LPGNSIRADVGIALIEGGDDHVDILAQHGALFAVERQAVQHRQRIRGNGGAELLDDVAVIVVVRGLDQ